MKKRMCVRSLRTDVPLIVPGSASFPAIASLGRRLLTALLAVRCTVALPLILIMILIMLFFFTFTFWLSFPFHSLLMFVPLRFLSAHSLGRHRTCPSRPCPSTCLVFLLICPFRLLPLACICLCSFLVAQPLPYHPILRKRPPLLSACAS